MSDHQRRFRNPNPLDAIRTQVRFLEKSARDFDAGDTDEALRMATAIRVLVHDTNSSTSILKQCELKDRLSFVDTMGVMDESGYSVELGAISNLFALSGAKFVPRLGHDPLAVTRLVSFSDWWTRDVIRDIGALRFSRKDLILEAVNKLGGAHVDRTPSPELSGVRTGEALGMSFAVDGRKMSPMIVIRLGPEFEPIPMIGDPIQGALETLIRQFTFELLETLRPALNANENDAEASSTSAQ